MERQLRIEPIVLDPTGETLNRVFISNDRAHVRLLIETENTKGRLRQRKPSACGS